MNYLKSNGLKLLIAFSLVVLTAFTLPASTAITPSPGSQPTPSPSPAITPVSPTPSANPNSTAVNDLIPLQTFDTNSAGFCQTEVNLEKTGGLTYACTDGKFTFQTLPKAKDTYKYLQVSQSIPTAERFILEADLLSEAAAGESDQNNYGFILGVDEENTYSLHFKGQYYRFEKNLIRRDYLNPDGKVFIAKTWNWNYSSAFKPAGNQNHIQLMCSEKVCELSINTQLAARINLDQPISITSLSLFAEVGYFKPFGKVSVDNLHLIPPTEPISTKSIFNLSDPLTNDQGVFPKTGLSGAYNRYQADGFHFSPVVGFGYYGVKSEPALGDVSVSATVRLNAENPTTSMYAGLVCRSSLDGMYFAVIRESGYFSVFRDSPTRPFSLLAEAKTKAILTGGAANRLRLDCIGSNISFYVNGTKVASVQDTTFNLISGRAGFFTKAGKNPNPDAIIFSDYEVKEIR
jgi:hypothetical protein